MHANLSQLESLQSAHGHSAPVTSPMAVFNFQQNTRVGSDLATADGAIQNLMAELEKAETKPGEARAFNRQITHLWQRIRDIVEKTGAL